MREATPRRNSVSGINRRSRTPRMYAPHEARVFTRSTSLLCKEVILLQLLVILLDEGVDDGRRARYGFGRERRFPGDPVADLVVDQEHPLEDTVLAHQIFGRRDVFLFRGTQSRRNDHCAGNQREKLPAVDVLVVHDNLLRLSMLARTRRRARGAARVRVRCA